MRVSASSIDWTNSDQSLVRASPAQSLQLARLCLRRLFHVRSLRDKVQFAVPVGIDGAVRQHQPPPLTLQDHLVH